MTSENDLRLLKISRESLEMGRDLRDWVASKITGRITISLHTAGVLYHIIGECNGDHLDIGTMHGGSAIFAAICMIETGRRGFESIVPLDNRIITTVDQFSGNDGEPITVSKVPVIEETAIANFKTFGVENRIKIIKTRTQKWLPNLHEYDTAFIDGGHDLESVHNDWMLLKDFVKKYIIFDDVCDKYPDVLDTFQFACSSLDWMPVYLAGIVGVMKRRE